jgi:hypothetical protein
MHFNFFIYIFAELVVFFGIITVRKYFLIPKILITFVMTV